MANKFQNPWDVGGEEYNKNALRTEFLPENSAYRTGINPNTGESVEEYQARVLGSDKDGDEDINEVGLLESSSGSISKCQAKKNAFPTASSIDKFYPKPYNKNPPNCQQKNPNGSWKWKNQCAIRMSIALIGAGVPLSKYEDPVCTHGHARGAKSLANWIWKYKLCPPNVYKGADASNILSKIKNRNGIIYFHNLSGEQDNDHIDLYRNGKTQAVFSNLWTAEEYWFFELNP